MAIHKDGESALHVLIIGAGSVGLLIAQQLKTLGISYTVYEREAYINARSRDWNFGISWAQSALAECLPRQIQENIASAQVDPSRAPGQKCYFPMLNAETGEVLMRMPTPSVTRLKRSKFRELIAEGIDVEYEKRISDIVLSENNDTVTAVFEDGTQATGSLLIGADGAKSRVRNFLLGSEKAGLQRLPLMGAVALASLPIDVAKQLRNQLDGEFLIAYHPVGLVAFISLHDVSDHSSPETWQWMLILTWRHYGNDAITDPAEIRKIWDKWSSKLWEPLRAAFLAAPASSTLRCDRIGQWPTVEWDNMQGRVTLAGDAAHPMTFHRGQGLNNAIQDAAHLGRALREVSHDGKRLIDAISAYEKEVVERGYEAVISSGENSMMVTDWSQLKNSPIFKSGLSGMAQDRK